MRKAYIRPFTLLELIVVMSIIFLASGMAVAVFRDQSPAKKLETASLEWRAFCSAVRFRALEAGSERQIIFNPEERVFRMYDPAAAQKEDEDEKEEDDKERKEEDESLYPKAQKTLNDLEWKLPDGFELGDFPPPEEEADVEDSYILFTFFGDGSASGKRKLELRCGELLGKVFEISALTGRMLTRDMSEEELQGNSEGGDNAK